MLFFFNDTATTEIYTLSLTTLFRSGARLTAGGAEVGEITSAAFSPALGKVVALGYVRAQFATPGDRKSTRLNSSHTVISYAVFCLKKKNITQDSIYNEYMIHARPIP